MFLSCFELTKPSSHETFILDDAMVFYLASLPNGIFKTVEKMFLLYLKGQLKGQKIPRSKKSVAATPPDLKGSKLKCLRGVDLEVCHKLLKDVVDKKSSLVELSGECMLSS